MRTDHKERITLEMNFLQIAMALSEGNPGALRVCCDIYKAAPDIDKDNFLGGVGPLLMLDSEGIYGPDIWMLFKDVCGQDITKMLACLRAIQLGGLAGVTSATLKGAIQNRGNGVDPDAALLAVRRKLPSFAPETT